MGEAAGGRFFRIPTNHEKGKLEGERGVSKKEKDVLAK